MKKIALIGSAPSSVRLAPYGNPEWEIWACSPGAWSALTQLGVKTHKWFELHRYEPGQPWFSPEYCQFLENYEGDVIMAQGVPSVKNCQVIAVDYLVQKYGPYFFTSSLAWMFAMAIEAGATTIGLWGVDMSATEEYGYQRAGCQYFAQLAKQMGIEVGIPPESDLLRPAPLYGVCEIQHGWIKTMARRRELQARLTGAEQQSISAQQEIMFVKGALDDLNWAQQTWFGSTDNMDYVEPPLVDSFPPLVTVESGQLKPEEVKDIVPGNIVWVDNKPAVAKKVTKKKAKKKGPLAEGKMKR